MNAFEEKPSRFIREATPILSIQMTDQYLMLIVSYLSFKFCLCGDLNISFLSKINVDS